jgi:hypothetical protein
VALGEVDLSQSVIVPVGSVAKALGWTLNRTKRWLAKQGILRKQIGDEYGRCYTTRALIRGAFPEAADDIIVRLAE